MWNVSETDELIPKIDHIILNLFLVRIHQFLMTPSAVIQTRLSSEVNVVHGPWTDQMHPFPWDIPRLNPPFHPHPEMTSFANPNLALHIALWAVKAKIYFWMNFIFSPALEPRFAIYKTVTPSRPCTCLISWAFVQSNRTPARCKLSAPVPCLPSEQPESDPSSSTKDCKACFFFFVLSRTTAAREAP